MVVISIIALLSSIVMASLQSARDKARNSYTISTIKQYINAIELAKGSDGQLPASALLSGGVYCFGDSVNGRCLDNAYTSEFNTFLQSQSLMVSTPSPVPATTDSTYSPGAAIYMDDSSLDGAIDFLQIYWTMQKESDSCVIPGTEFYTGGSDDYYCYLSLYLNLWSPLTSSFGETPARRPSRRCLRL